MRGGRSSHGTADEVASVGRRGRAAARSRRGSGAARSRRGSGCGGRKRSEEDGRRGPVGGVVFAGREDGRSSLIGHPYRRNEPNRPFSLSRASYWERSARYMIQLPNKV